MQQLCIKEIQDWAQLDQKGDQLEILYMIKI